MTETEAALIVRRIYWFALGFGVAGCVTYFFLGGWRTALAFALGAAVSVGNLWLFDRITHSIEPETEGEAKKNPWKPLILILRYFLLLALGYAIVKTLSVNALAVVLGLLTSTAAILTSTVFELVESFLVSRSSR